VLDQHGDQRFIVQEQDTRQELLSSKGLLAPAIKAILSWPCKNRGRMTIFRKRTRQPSCRGESRRPNVRCGQRGPSFWSVSRSSWWQCWRSPCCSNAHAKRICGSSTRLRSSKPPKPCSSRFGTPPAACGHSC